MVWLAVLWVAKVQGAGFVLHGKVCTLASMLVGTSQALLCALGIKL